METDSEIMYKEIIDKKNERNWRLYPFVKEIQERIRGFEGFECKWIARSTNHAADWIAKQVRKGMSYSNWVNMPSSSLVHILNKDGLPAPPCSEN